jgi:hypothetical protein
MRSPRALAGPAGPVLLLAIASFSLAYASDPGTFQGDRGTPTMFQEGHAAGRAVLEGASAWPLDLPYRPDALWVQSPDLDGLVGSSEVISRFGLVSEIANDFILVQASVIETITWWGGYYSYLPGDPLVTGFNLYLYVEGRDCFPGNQILELIIPNNCNETFIYDQFGFPIYEYSIDVEPIAVPATASRWLGIQAADHPFPPQWGRLEAPGHLQCNSVFRSEYFSYSDWTDIDDVFEPLPEMAFALYGRAAAPGEACCFSDGSCMSVADKLCAASGGTPQGAGSTCTPNPCAEVVTLACCLADGSCRIETPEDCEAAGGGSLPDEEYCSQFPCPEAQGCCLPDGGCELLIVEVCIAQGGVPRGQGSDCADPCPGRCCFTMGTCRLSLEEDCALAGGFFVPGATCLPNPCPPPETPRACCFADHACDVRSVEDCLRDGGQPRLPGTACDPNPCVPTSGPHACCFGDGGCRLLLQDACIEGGGLPLGACTICEPNPCPDPPWACCLADGTCVAVTEPECADQEGVWLPETTCTEGLCSGVHTEAMSWGHVKAMFR